MFKKDSQLSVEKRFSISFIVLIFSVFALFVFQVFLRPELVDLINVLISDNNLSVLDYIIYGIGWFIIILIGILWVSVGLLPIMLEMVLNTASTGPAPNEA